MVFLFGVTAMSSDMKKTKKVQAKAAVQQTNCTTTYTICDAAWPQDFGEDGIDSNYAGFDACMSRNGC
uniref:hypothetical protein n=1 Tax=Zhouia sp. PK063 TaxID=3373602 RepID=UPI0037DD8D62